MYRYKEKADNDEVFDIKMAVVQVKPGESNREAWSRHIQANPRHAEVRIKVFNLPPIK